jgi:signal transduction histidine kinase
MLRNLKVGTKLLAVIVPPLAVLVVVAGIGLMDRRTEADDARAVARGAELMAASSQLAEGLQVERTASMVALAERSPDDAATRLAAVRPVTDVALEEFRRTTDAVLAGDPPPELADAVDDARTRTDDLGTIREQIDAGNVSIPVAEAWFSDTLRAMTSMNAEVATNTAVPDVSDDLSTAAALERARESQARGASTLALALTEGRLDPDGRQWRTLATSLRETEGYLALTYEIAEPTQAATLRTRLAAPEVAAIDGLIDQVLVQAVPGLDTTTGVARGEPVRIRLSVDEWLAAAEANRSAMARTGQEILAGVTTVTDEIVDEAANEALLFALAVAGAVLASALVAVVVARRTSKPLRELTEAAERLSTDQLPALVEQLRSPRPEQAPDVLEPIAMDRSDEIGQLAEAFDAVQRVTVDVAAEQASLLRRGIGDIFVNLARRNQALLDRQIEFIDHLEAREEDPDALDDLFKLDHLATRMRRNAESLLVLAGADTGHRRARPVALADVVRVAVGEVEDFARLKLLALDDAVVAGAAAVDLAHLLSELMENATQFSPPDTRVEILGHRARDGGYVVSVSDQGLGMSEDQLAEANRLLAEPPVVGLALSRSLGFTVIGRLAARFGIRVRLTTSPAGGVTALVTLPTSVLAEGPDDERLTGRPTAAATTRAPVDPPPADPAPAIEAAARDRDDVPEPPTRSGRPDPAPAADPPPLERRRPGAVPEATPERLTEALPEGEAFDAGLATLLPERGAAAPPAPVEPPVTEAPTTDAGLVRRVPTRPSPEPSEPTGEAGPEPSTAPTGDTTPAGLARRTPRAAPEAHDDGRAAAAPHRSPEEVRAMLARYRSGLRAGRGPGAPADPQPTDAPGGDR